MIGAGHEYEQLLAHTVEMKVDEALKIRVLDLEMQIRIKEEVAGEKDSAVLPILRRTLIEKSRHRK